MIGSNMVHALDRLSSALAPSIEARFLTTSDLPALEALRREVVTGQLFKPECYRFDAEPKDFPGNHLGQSSAGESGVIVGLFDKASSILIAHAALTLDLPDLVKTRFAEALHLPKGEGRRLASLASAMVHRDWHGSGLHHHLIQFRIDLAEALGYRHLTTTIWPGNHPSWAHMTAHGFRGKSLVEVYGGHIRLLLHRDLASVSDRYDPDTRRLVDVEDLALYEELLASGRWLWRRLAHGDGLFAEFGHPLD